MDWVTRRKPRRKRGILRGHTPGIQYQSGLKYNQTGTFMQLTAEWVVGFVDGVGIFQVDMAEHPDMSTGYQVLPEFTVVQQERDIQILYALKRFFGFGVVRKNHADRYAYRVRKLEHLERLCDFFLKHPLKTRKNVDFRKFRRVVLMMKEGRHRTREGLAEIIDLVSSMNTGDRPRLEAIKAQLVAG